MSCGNCGRIDCGGCAPNKCTTCGGINCGCINNITCSQTIPGAINAGVRACSPLAGCGNVLTSSPTPFYGQAPQCQENNCQQINTFSFCPTVKNDNAFNMPACGQQALFVSSELCSIQVGSYLWSDTYGYLEVIAFDSNTKQVTVQNNCNEDNAAPGTKITACSEFTNVDPPAPDNNPGVTPCLALDFTAPAVGNCIDITVTTVNGLQVGFLITIGSGTYRVDAILSPTVITICNDGMGITPGTPVIALNASGQFQYCFSIISVNPCEQDPIEAGVPLVCDGEGSIVPLDDGDDNDVLTFDSGTNTASWQAIVFPPVDPCGDYENETAIYILTPVNSDGSIVGNPAADPPGPYPVSYTLTSNQFMISNPSTCRTMRGMYQFDYVINLKCLLEDVDTEANCLSSLYTVEFQVSVDGGAFVNQQVWSSVGFENQPVCDFPFVFNYAWGGSFSGQINLLPAAGTTFQSRLVFTYVDPLIAPVLARMEVLTSTEIGGTALTVAV